MDMSAFFFSFVFVFVALTISHATESISGLKEVDLSSETNEARVRLDYETCLDFLPQRISVKVKAKDATWPTFTAIVVDVGYYNFMVKISRTDAKNGWSSLLLSFEWTAYKNCGERYNNSCLEVFSKTSTYQQANVICTDRGGLVVPVKTRDLLEFVLKIAKPFKTHLFWIGLTDIENEGTWVFSDGEHAGNKTFWAFNQPDKLDNEDCAVINVVTKEFHDYSCGTKFPFICQYSIHFNSL
ncbi:snaclec 7-like [Ciona intestinalis]